MQRVVFLWGLILLGITLLLHTLRQDNPFYYLSYLADQDGQSELYLAYGTHAQQRTHHHNGEGVCWYDWSQTGKTLYIRWDLIFDFTCTTGLAHYGELPLQSHVYKPQQYSSTVRSPDEKWLIRTQLDPLRGYVQYIYRMDSSGNTKELLAELDPLGRVDLMWRAEAVIFSQSTEHGRFFYHLHPFTKTLSPLRVNDHAAKICENWSLSPDGQTLYFLMSDERDWCNLLFIYHFSTGEYEQVQTFDLPLWDIVSWSPDGTHLAYWDILDDKLYLLSAKTGQHQNIESFHLFPYFNHAQGSWSPDGEFLVYTALQDNILRVFQIRKDGSDLRALTSADYNSVMPKYSPLFPTPTFFASRGILLGFLLMMTAFIRRP